jgi:hemoglobin
MFGTPRSAGGPIALDGTAGRWDMRPEVIRATYETRLGGADVLARVVESLYVLALDDSILAPVFARVDLPALHQHQIQFLGAVLGSNAPAIHDQMQRAHTGLEITPRQFARMAQHLQTALSRAGVPEDLAGEIGDHVEGLRDDIVGR